MSVEFFDEGSCWRFVAAGRFDRRNGASETLERLTDIPAKVTEIRYDFEEATHLMNDGLKAIVVANDAMNARGGSFEIVKVSPGIMRVLRMNGLDALAEGSDLADLS